jgi:predicted phosphohydrolase
LSLATPDKSMELFGPAWADHPERMQLRWRERVTDQDLVLVPGDISWAMRLEQALPDLELLADLPGRKVLVRGNHDYWWGSVSKVRHALPAGMYAVHNDALSIDGVTVAGTRLWDDLEIRFGSLELREPKGSTATVYQPEDSERTERIFQRELGRLRLALERLDPGARLRIAVVHYPPLGPQLEPTRASEILEAAAVDHCVFGHLHGLAPMASKPLYGERNGIRYWLTSCDYLDFEPVQIAEL